MTGRGQGNTRGPGVAAAAALLALALALAFPATAAAQTAGDDYMARVERALALEREIAELQGRLAQAQKDRTALSSRLEDIHRKMLDCYRRIEDIEAQVERARRLLNAKFRYLYMEGDKEDLVRLMSASSIADFVTRYSYVMKMASGEAIAFRLLREKRRALREKQERLGALKKEAAELARGSDTAPIEALIAQKRDELARVSGSIIGEQIPSSNLAVPARFSPGLVYSKPDDSGFARTGQVFSGYASWYGEEFHNGATASGEVYDQHGFTCAHRTLPFGTWLRLTFRGRSVIVKVNDRGPSVPGRTLGLSRGAAEAVGMTGVQWIDCELVVPR